jgi:ABC-type polysaccharide/polyol phosphate export permease
VGSPAGSATALRPPARWWEVFRTLTAVEIKEERDLTVTGFLRWTLEPLSYMVVYLILLGAIFNRPREAFPLFLLAALIPFRFFSETIFRAMAVVKSNASIITNRNIPRDILPLVTVASHATTLVLSMFLLVPFMVFYDAPFTPALLWMVPTIGILLVLTTGPAYLAALFGLYFPNFRGAAQNLVRVSFFVSTALVALKDIPGQELPVIFDLNPLSGVFDSFRAAILRGRMPGELDLLYPLAVGLVLLAAGWLLYRRRQDQFAKEV